MATVKVAKKSVSGDVVKIVFANGKTVEADINKLSPEIIRRLAVHGLSQKLGDTYAGAKGDVNVAIAGVEGTWEALLEGNYNRRGGGGVSILAEAVARVQGVDIDDVYETLKEMDEEQQKAVAAHPAIKAEMAAIKAERAREAANVSKGSVDLGSLFGK